MFRYAICYGHVDIPTELAFYIYTSFKDPSNDGYFLNFYINIVRTYKERYYFHQNNR